MPYCVKCKEDWRREKLEAVRQQARTRATELNETMAIEKYGPIYKIVKANEATAAAIEYISKHVA